MNYVEKLAMKTKLVMSEHLYQEEQDDFAIFSKGFSYHNGRGIYNRQYHCQGGRTLFLAGSKPRLLMFNNRVFKYPWIKFGEYSMGIIEEKGSILWLHDFDEIKATDRLGYIAYDISHSHMKGVSFSVEFMPMSMANGCIIRIRASVSKDIHLKLIWTYGGMTTDFEGSSYYCPFDIGRYKVKPNPQDTLNNVINIGHAYFKLTHKKMQNVVVLGGCDYSGNFEIASAIPRNSKSNMVIHKTNLPLKKGDRFTGNVVICWEKEQEFTPERIKILIEKAKINYRTSKDYFRQVAHQATIETPDKNLNLAMKYANISADSCWKPPAFVHSPSTWSEWYVGWRQQYGPTAIGWYDRVASAIRFHSQHRNSPDSFPRSQKDNKLENAFIYPKKYHHGRIHMTIDPITGKAAGHHDCVQLFIDFLHYLYCWTGDKIIIKDLWNILKDATRWQKLARDPDDDGLYVNVLNTWISDSHEYHQGACTVQSAYVWKNNLEMAEWAEALGKDSCLYLKEAEKIKHAMLNKLWLKDKGYFAEYRDINGVLHPCPESTSVYHPIEFGIVEDAMAYQMLEFAKRELLSPDGIIYGSGWFPTGRCCHRQPIVGETINMALAFYKIAEYSMGYRLLKAVTNNLYKDFGIIHKVWGRFIPLSFQSDTGDINFLDNISLYQRAIIEGLFGIMPEVQKNMVTITPNFPSNWKKAKIVLPEIQYEYRKNSQQEEILITTSRGLDTKIRIRVKDKVVKKVTVNGKKTLFHFESGIGKAFLMVRLPGEKSPNKVVVSYKHTLPARFIYSKIVAEGSVLIIKCINCIPVGFSDPQGILEDVLINKYKIHVTGRVVGSLGKHTFFLNVSKDGMLYTKPVDIEIRKELGIKDARLIWAKANNVYYEFSLFNNGPSKNRLVIKSEFAGQADCSEVRIRRYGKKTIRHKLLSESISNLNPGQNALKIKIFGGCETVIEQNIIDWDTSIRKDEIGKKVKKNIGYISLENYSNACFEREFFKRVPLEVRYGFNVSDVNRIVDDSYLRRRTRGGVFLSDIGVPFRIGLKNKKNVICLGSKFRRGIFQQGYLLRKWGKSFYEAKYPNNIEIGINKAGIGKIYIMFAGSTSWMQSHVPHIKITVNYRDDKEVVELTPPDTFDFILQHYSNNYKQILTTKVEDWYYDIYPRQEHVDIIDILTKPEKEIVSLQFNVLSLDTTMAILGISLLKHS